MTVFVSFNGGRNYFKFQSYAYGKVTHKINMHYFLDKCLGLTDALSANERADIIACILLVYHFRIRHNF